MDYLSKMAVENAAWKEGYVEALEKALESLEAKGRFGLEKVVAELKEEITQYKPKETP